jgi:hypothetical protein
MTFTYVPFGIVPSWCDVSISCNSVSPSGILDCQELNSDNQLTWSFDGTDYNGDVTPGTYTYTFDVTILDKTEQFTVDVVLTDPCENPTITMPNPTSIVYVITDAEGRYTLEPELSVDPEFCKFEITVEVDDIVVTYDP